MDYPCPFIRLTIESLALKLPLVATKPAGSGIHSSTTPCFCKLQLKNLKSSSSSSSHTTSTALLRLCATTPDDSPPDPATTTHTDFHLDPALLQQLSGKPTLLQLSVYTGSTTSMGRTTCGVVSSRKLLGRLRVSIDLDLAKSTRCEYQNGWLKLGKGGQQSASLHLAVRAEPDPRFVFQFGGEPECSPVVFQIQGNIRQPVLSCKFSADRNSRTRSLRLDSSNSSRGWMNTFANDGNRPGRERKGWMIMVYDLSGSPVAAASMITPFVPSQGSDRVSRSNPGAWLILRPNGSSVSSWKPWGRLEAWRERGSVDSLGYKFELVTGDGPNSGTPIVEGTISVRKGGQFCIDSSVVGSESTTGSCLFRGFVMGSTVEGEGKVSKPLVQVGVKRVTCMADAALFVALSAAMDLSMDACRLFSNKLRKELCHDQQDYLS